LGIVDHVFGQRPADPHPDGAIDLAVALHRVDRLTDIGGMDAVENLDLPGDPVHSEAKTLNVKGSGAR
jgi:hypothetical protein